MNTDTQRYRFLRYILLLSPSKYAHITQLIIEANIGEMDEHSFDQLIDENIKRLNWHE